MDDKSKKQVPLRLSTTLYNDLAKWAEHDFRSVNGQIEYVLHTCVEQWKKSGRYTPPDMFDGKDNESADQDP